MTLVRVTETGEARLPPRSFWPDGISVIEHEIAGDADAAVAWETAVAVCAERSVVLDLPVRYLADARLRARADVAVVTVGPTPLDEHLASSVLAAIGSGPPDTTRPAPAWLLGCGRAGGEAASTEFERAMSVRAAGHGAEEPVRVLPVVLPYLSRQEALRLTDGDTTARTLRAGLSLVAALRIVRGDPHAPAVDPKAFADQLVLVGEAARQPDDREVGERLHALADELVGIRAGVKPTAADLAGVPRLEDWKAESRPVRILSGRVYGHPDISDGRRIATSDLYASDGETWARTLSRYYALGAPSSGRAGTGLN